VEGWELRHPSRANGNRGAWKGLVFVVGMLVVLLIGAWVLARPAIGGAVTDLFVENPSVIRWPIVSDLLRAELADRVNVPASSQAREVRFVIEAGEGIAEVEAALTEQGVVTDSLAFNFLVQDDRVDELIVPGIYTMDTSMTPTQVVAKLRSPDPPIPQVTMAVRDGLRIEQITALLQKMKEEDGLELDPKEFRELALNPPASLRDEYPFLKQAPEGRSLEGFLAGDTWSVDQDIEPLDLIRGLLDNWNDKLGNLVTQARRKDVDFYDALIIASLVERETPTDAERPRIAGVYWNRLDPKVNGETTGLMQADPTVVYAADTMALEDLGVKQWPDYVFWDTLGRDLNTVQVPDSLSSFQTYLNPGLPDWPIVTPSRASLEAALEPNRKRDLLYFYACPGEETHTFARTQAQHLANIAKCQ
jgi:UPF0755 protein